MTEAEFIDNMFNQFVSMKPPEALRALAVTHCKLLQAAFPLRNEEEKEALRKYIAAYSADITRIMGVSRIMI